MASVRVAPKVNTKRNENARLTSTGSNEEVRVNEAS